MNLKKLFNWKVLIYLCTLVTLGLLTNCGDEEDDLLLSKNLGEFDEGTTQLAKVSKLVYEFVI